MTPFSSFKIKFNMQKMILAVLLILVANTASAQKDPCNYIIDSIDIFDKVRVLTLLPERITSNADLSAFARNNIFAISIKTEKIIGVDENSSIQVLYTDDTKQEYKHGAGLNYKGDFTFPFFNDKDIDMLFLKRMLEKNIKAIRLTGLSDTYSFLVDEKTSSLLKSKLNCLFLKWSSNK